MMKLFLLTLLSLFIFSCQKQQFKLTNNVVGDMKSNPDYSEWDHQFLWGLVPTAKHDVFQICGNSKGADYVQTQQSFATGFLTVITYGIYSPRIYKVQCVSK